MSDRVPLFLVQPEGGLVPMKPSAPSSEEALQELIARHPALIADGDELLLIEREHGVPDAPDASPRWSLDHLFVTRSGIPVLVEVKRASDTRLRREVVGQMLDYAANSVVHWPAGTIAERFAAACGLRGLDAELKLQEFLPQGVAAPEFWAQVDANFNAGRVKLVFVADEIPPELARIVEFMTSR